ncbi:MAG: sodium:solute symporter family protein, partial [Candidatus Competibacterales bacterium]|nr:sodium:solute symporter family protein [Candidatus Competibacterales bacterium]
MNLSPQVTWIFLLVMVYWAYAVACGIQGARRATTVDHYFLAGRQLPFWAFVMAATATTYSGWSFIGSPGQIYAHGLPYSGGQLSAITMPLAGVLLLKRQWLLGRRFGFVTPGEMLAYYFRSDLLRLLVVLVALVFSVPYLGVQLRAAGFLFSALTDGLLTVDFGMWVLAVVVLSYVASGGLRTVAYVAILQGLLLVVGIVVIGTAAVLLVGGWGPLVEGMAALSQHDPLRTPDGHSHYVAIPGVIQMVDTGSEATGGPWTGMMILTYHLGLIGIMASPAFSMWAYASRSPAPFAAQQVWASALVMGLVTMVFITVQGFGGHLLGADPAFAGARPDLVRPLLSAAADRQDMMVPELIGRLGTQAPWLVGLLAVCALAAMESTAACYMATAGSVLTRDLFRRFLLPRADDRTQKFVARLCVMALVVLALVVASSASRALVLLGGLAVSYAFQLVPALVAACYWPFLTRQGVTAGLVAGLIGVTLTDAIGPRWLGIDAWGAAPLTLHPAFWGMLCNLALALPVSLLTCDDAARKREFHTFLVRTAALPARKRRLVPLAWILLALWYGFAAGP